MSAAYDPDNFETVYYWADGTWCTQDELEDMDYMSDDYALLVVPIHWTYEQVDLEVQNCITFHHAPKTRTTDNQTDPA